MVSTKAFRADSISVAHAIETVTTGQGYLTAPIDVKDADNLGAYAMTLFYKLAMNAVVPGGGENIEIYALFGDGDGEFDAGSPGTALVLTGVSSPTVANVQRNAKLIKTIPLDPTASLVYEGSETVQLTGVANVAFAFIFNTNAAPHLTHGNHGVKYVNVWSVSL